MILLKDFLKLYDNWNGYTVIKDKNLELYARLKTVSLAENEDVNSRALNAEVLSFGFYDKELTIRVNM